MNRDTTLDQVLASLQDNDKLFLLDGGTGRELFRRGVPDDRKMWSARAVVDPRYHDTLLDVHQSFLEAGAQCIKTNSYCIIPSAGFTHDEIARHCSTASRLARQAVTEHSTQAFVLGSLGPLVESYRPDLILKHEQGVPYYVNMITAMAPDAFLAETMSSVEESMQPIQALAQSNKNEALWIALTLNSHGKLRSGQTVVEAIPRILDYARQQRVQVPVILFNCCEPHAITLALQEIRDSPAATAALARDHVLLGAYGNRLRAVASDWTLESTENGLPMRHDADPQEYYEIIEKWFHDFNVRLIGGCCGITPEHIEVLNAKLPIVKL